MVNKLTPCISVCTLENDICIGCGRTKKEITEWLKYSKKKRMIIMRRLKNAKGYNDGND